MADTKQIGLVFNKILGDDFSWIFDSHSIEPPGSSWSDFGYEIVFRPEEIRASGRIIDELKSAFMKPFNLPRENFRFDFTFWHIYWNRPNLRASMIKACEDGLDTVAKRNNIAVKLNGVIIQPRPSVYLTEEIKWNKKNINQLD